MDVATLGIRVTQDGVAQATQNLNSMAAAGDKAEASTKKLGTTTAGLTRFQQDLVNRAREVFQAAELLDVQNKNAVKQWEKQRDMWAEIAARHKQTAVVENELAAATQLVTKNQMAAAEYAKRLSDAQKEMNATAGRLGPGINSVRSALTSMTASMLGAAPGVGQLTGVLGSLALGSTLMVGVLAGVAAVAGAYRLFTEDARKAAEQQKKLTDSLLEWYRAKQAGGEGAQQIEATTKAIAQEQVEIDKLTKKLVELNNAYNAKTGLRDESAIAATKSQIAALTKTIEEQQQAITARQTADSQSIASAALQLERQRALNDAFGNGAVALARINAEYDYREAKLQNDAQYAPAVAAAHNAIAAQMRDETIRAAELTEAQRQLEELQKSQTKTLDELRASLEKTNVEWTLNAKQYERIIDLNKQLNEAQAKIGGSANSNAKKMADDIDKAAEAIKKAERYSKDMETIWRDGIGKIVTDGTKSFHDFFEDVLQMFSALMKRMEQEGKASGGLYGLLGIGGAAITGGLAGYGVGSATGSAAAGVGSGALTGAMSGAAFGPWGVAIGGLAGAIGGLLGAAHAHSEAAKALREAADRIKANISSYVDSAGAGETVYSKLDADTAKYNALLEQLHEGFRSGAIVGSDYYQQVTKLTAAHEVLQQKIVEEAHAADVAAQFEDFRAKQDLRLRALRAQGLSDEADEMQRQLEVQDAINAGRSDEYVALLQQVQALEKAAAAVKKSNDAFFQMADAAYAATVAARNYAFQQYQQSIADPTNDPNAFSSALSKQTSLFTSVYQTQIDIARAQLKVQQDSQKTAEQSFTETKKAFDSLTQFKASLSIGDISVLSPLGQKNAAESALKDLYRQAQLGDKTAAANFGGAAQTFLQLSRGYNASGAGFVTDQANVARMTDSLLTQYGVQQTIDQQMLDAQNTQVSLLQQQIDLNQQQVDAINRASQTIQQLYDKMFGSASGSIASVWDNITKAALAQVIGGTPAGITPGNPYAVGPNGLPFGNTTPYGPATVAERFFYAFQQYLATQPASSATPNAAVAATEQNTDTLRAGFTALVAAVNEVKAAQDENTRQIKNLAAKVA